MPRPPVRPRIPAVPDPRPLLRPTVRLGAIEFDVARRTAHVGSAAYRLSGSALRLLYLLAANPGRVLTREEIRDGLGSHQGTPTSNPVDRLVLQLRRELSEDGRHPSLVETVLGGGYRLAAGTPGEPAT